MSLWSWRPQSGAETDAAQTPTQSARPLHDCSVDDGGASRSLDTEESAESVLGLRAGQAHKGGGRRGARPRAEDSQGSRQA